MPRRRSEPQLRPHRPHPTAEPAREAALAEIPPEQVTALAELTAFFRKYPPAEFPDVDQVPATAEERSQLETQGQLFTDFVRDHPEQAVALLRLTDVPLLQQEIIRIAAFEFAKVDKERAVNFFTEQSTATGVSEPEIANGAIYIERRADELRLSRLREEALAAIKSADTPQAAIAAREAARAMPEMDDFWATMEYAMSDRIEQHLVAAFEQGAEAGATLVHSLPDTLPHAHEIYRKVYTEFMYRASQATTEYQEAVAQIKELFRTAPELQAVAATDYHFRRDWDNAERFETAAALVKRGNREASVALFSPTDFDSGQRPVMADLLFNAYRRAAPLKVVENIADLRDQFAALPAAEQEALVTHSINEGSVFSFRRVIHEFHLTEAQVAAFAEKNGMSRPELAAHLETENPLAVLQERNRDLLPIAPEAKAELKKRFRQESPLYFLRNRDQVAHTPDEVKKAVHSAIYQGVTSFIDSIPALGLTEAELAAARAEIIEKDPRRALTRRAEIGLTADEADRVMAILIREDAAFVLEQMATLDLNVGQRGLLIDSLTQKEPAFLIMRIAAFELDPVTAEAKILEVIAASPLQIFRRYEEVPLTEPQTDALVAAVMKSDPAELLVRIDTFPLTAEQRQVVIAAATESRPDLLLRERARANLTTEEVEAALESCYTQNPNSLLMLLPKLGLAPEKLTALQERFIDHRPETYLQTEQLATLTAEQQARMVESLILGKPLVALAHMAQLPMTPESTSRLFGWLVEDHPIELAKNLDRFPEANAEAAKSRILTACIKKLLSRPSNGAEVHKFFQQKQWEGVAVNWDQVGAEPLPVGTVDGAIYESARQIPNQDIQRKVWMVLSGGGEWNDFLPIAADSAQPREEYAASVPPHLYGVVQNVFPGSTINNVLETTYAKVGRLKKGGTELRGRLEFSVASIGAEMWRLGMRPLQQSLEQLASHDLPPATVVRLLDAIAMRSHVQQALRVSNTENADWMRLQAGQDPETWMRQLQAETVAMVKDLFGLESMTIEQFERVQQEWGDTRSILILATKYASGFREGMPLLRESFAAILNDEWHGFRYDEEDPVVARQLQGLSVEQKKAWITNQESASLAEIKIEKVEAEQKAEQIRADLLLALENGHVSNLDSPETQRFWGSTAHQWALNGLRGETGYSPAEIGTVTAAVGLKLFEATKLKGLLGRLGNPPVATIDQLRAFGEAVTTEIDRIPTDKKKRNAKQEAYLTDLRAAQRWAEEKEPLLDDFSGLLDRAGVTAAMPLKELAEIRKGLEDAANIVRLANLSPEEIRANALKDETGQLKRGVLADWLKKLEANFSKRESAFAQDIQNALLLIEQSGEAASFTDAVIEESDDPKTLFEAGKYPLGSGSCQNFEGNVDWNCALLAYVADADKKIVNIRTKDGTIIARAIVKLVYINDREPALFLEPTYTSVNKADQTFSADMDRYLKQKAKAMGGIPVLRGYQSGETEVTVRASRNAVQYEDGGAGGADHAGLGKKRGEYKMRARAI